MWWAEKATAESEVVKPPLTSLLLKISCVNNCFLRFGGWTKAAKGKRKNIGGQADLLENEESILVYQDYDAHFKAF